MFNKSQSVEATSMWIEARAAPLVPCQAAEPNAVWFSAIEGTAFTQGEQTNKYSKCIRGTTLTCSLTLIHDAFMLNRIKGEGCHVFRCRFFPVMLASRGGALRSNSILRTTGRCPLPA